MSIPGVRPLRALLAAFALVLPISAQDGPQAPVDLRCEYRVDPPGISARKPRFSWEVVDPGRGAVQSAYEIVVTESTISGAPVVNVWESGKVVSRETCQVDYAGAPLESLRRYTWKVRTYDGEGRESRWSAPASFGIGPLDAAGWKARWIGDPAPVAAAPAAKLGFHSQFAEKEDDQKWVQIDLGGQVVLDGIRLHPTRGADAGGQPGYLFPLKIKVWVCDRPDFERDYMKVADYTYNDIPNPGAEPFPVSITSRYNIRYIRLGATKMGRVEGKGYAFALAELEATLQGQVVSTGAKVTAGDSIEDDAWGAANLTDGVTGPGRPKAVDPRPPPLLRKEFHLDGAVVRGTLYASALGLFEARINGQRVGDDQLAPGWTDYRVRAPYIAHDVTGLLKPGKNAIAAQIADGWYAGRIGLAEIVPGGPARSIYGPKPRFLAQIEVELADGRRQTIATDGSWKCTTEGPVRSADLLDGEVYDARAEKAGFDSPGYDESAWVPVEAAKDVEARLEALACEPARIVEVVRAVGLKEPKPGVHVFDVGQNLAGWCRLRLVAPAGTEVTLRHGERVDADGSLYTANLRGAAQTDRYTCRGGGEVFEPRFTIHGFRFVEVTGLPAKPVLTDLEACAVSNGAEDVGSFEASDPMLGKLWKNVEWTLRSNLLSVPTDCPQRDERLGWMGDFGAFARTAAYQLDLAGFFPKWLADVRDAQAKDGRFPDFAPHPLGKDERFNGAPAWGDAGVSVPWVAWVHYGDRRLLGEHLDAVVRWLDWIRAANPELVWKNARGNDYGDWLNGDSLVKEGWPTSGGDTPKEVFATAFFARSAQLASKMAAAVGRAEDARKLDELARGIAAAFRKAFVAEDGTIQGGAQGGYALALAFELLTPEQQEKALALLVQNIETTYGGHLSTGFHSTLPAMMELTRRGHAELATKLALARTFPSWGYEIDQGATTVWERWDGFVDGRGPQDAGMNSFNHFAFGSVGEWMMRALAGIEPDEAKPGWAHFTVHPRAGSGVSFVSAEHETIRGKIASRWDRRDGRFQLEVTIPANTTATVVLPTGDAGKISEGGKAVAQAAPHARIVDKSVARSKPGETVLEVAAGTYRFVVAP